MIESKVFSLDGTADKMIVTLTNGKTVEFVVTDQTSEYVRYESRNCLGEYVPMTKMNEWLHKQFSLLPDELKAAIIPTERVYRDSKGKIHKETVKLFLPSASEIFADDECSFNADKGLYEQLDYYKDAHNRVRALKDGDGHTDWYWTSTPYSGDSANWCYVSYGGFANSFLATYTWIGAPVCFRIKKSEESAPLVGAER